MPSGHATAPSGHDRAEPWTEAEFLALERTHDRIELVDGRLRARPAPNVAHQGITSQMTMAVYHSARAAGLLGLRAINVRLSPRTIVIPDLVVGTMDRLGDVTDAAEVLLIGEIQPRARADELLAYASAGIPWYLLAEPDLTDYRSITLRLYRLDGATYAEKAVAAHGEILRSDAPFPFAIDTAELLRF